MLPRDRLYSTNHEWLMVEGDRVLVGITHVTAERIHGVLRTLLPLRDHHLSKGDELVTIETANQSYVISSPASGVVQDCNDALSADPEPIASDCYSQGWIAILQLDSVTDLDQLLNADAYQTLLEADSQTSE